MSKFFSKFPTIMYNGYPAKNLLVRTSISNATRNVKEAFVEHEVEDHFSRPDMIANEYYGNSHYDWLYYYSNDIINPYTDRYMNDEEFSLYINSQYNFVYARDYILYYRNNWSVDNEEISVERYEALPPNVRRYYNHVNDYFGSVVSYKRKPMDWVLDNNKIRTLTVADGYEMTYYTIGGLYKQYNTTTNEIVASGMLSNVDLDKKQMTFVRISGSFQEGADYRLVGKYTYTKWKYVISSVSNPYVVNGVEQDCIPDSEAVFWTPVSIYEHFSEKNQQNRKVKLVRNSLKGKIEDSFKELMRL